MKYCSKCGNELLDEAVFCVKCGCSCENTNKLADEIFEKKRHSNLSLASILNNIAAIGNAIIAVFSRELFFINEKSSTHSGADVSITFGSSGGIDSDYTGRRILEEPKWFAVWILSIIAVFVIGFLISKCKKKKMAQMLSYIYMLTSVASAIFMLKASTMIENFIVCGFGLIFFVPVVLQIIAGINFIQAKK